MGILHPSRCLLIAAANKQILQLECFYYRELNDFVLPIGIKHVPDILSFGTQESCSERLEWEISLQETIGPSHILFHSTSLGKCRAFIITYRNRTE